MVVSVEQFTTEELQEIRMLTVEAQEDLVLSMQGMYPATILFRRARLSLLNTIMEKLDAK